MHKSIGGVEKTIVEAAREHEDKTQRCEKLAAEIRKIYIENRAKTTRERIRTEEASLEVKKR